MFSFHKTNPPIIPTTYTSLTIAPTRYLKPMDYGLPCSVTHTVPPSRIKDI